ncbi:hypothetical protein HUG10_21085 (plasmid) [Halorarum halophilum]|uniref:Uncharacterized protein n=1 Tax=Halorarum halophilum TaxID=2743090 RepID=A0A7D5L338_9EURY|nr:hypothetical protein [Halobaculum halophilum]QLG30083.1 hypothetical protein HUG10_21085 [Halobaculum halophilum]
MEVAESLDDDARYALRGDDVTVKFDDLRWAGGSWVLTNDDVEVAIVRYNAVPELSELYEEVEN